MKLVIAIVQDEDAPDVLDSLTDKDFRVTKLATTGGFLKAGNTTLMVGVEEDKLDQVIDIVKDICKKRKEIVVSPTPLTGNDGGYIQQCPMQINVGGATIFVVDVDKFIKI
ncbi:cyclic-di-AMP receptor [Clostridium weizhouense]|uniref:Cyclic-di-AMP receptor n=1 Tax=Clostridium weizhouense TaxID=2859781 RepID=A0ABS7AS74_9CLOT|nr:cyclic-di-AMP receptor [Clostridium weizhouense]MBW6410340.1 cyclic-di-AMP receptor [Clostridium weizhouense]